MQPAGAAHLAQRVSRLRAAHSQRLLPQPPHVAQQLGRRSCRAGGQQLVLLLLLLALLLTFCIHAFPPICTQRRMTRKRLGLDAQHNECCWQ